MRDGCPFCDYSGPSEIEADLGDVFVIQPMAPHGEGHRIVIPRRHVEGFTELVDGEDSTLLFERVMEVAAKVSAGRPANIIASYGRVSTQTVPHLHVHVVPRFPDDGEIIPWGQLARDHLPKPQPGTPEYEELARAS